MFQPLAFPTRTGVRGPVAVAVKQPMRSVVELPVVSGHASSASSKPSLSLSIQRVGSFGKSSARLHTVAVIDTTEETDGGRALPHRDKHRVAVRGVIAAASPSWSNHCVKFRQSINDVVPAVAVVIGASQPISFRGVAPLGAASIGHGTAWIVAVAITVAVGPLRVITGVGVLAVCPSVLVCRGIHRCRSATTVQGSLDRRRELNRLGCRRSQSPSVSFHWVESVMKASAPSEVDQPLSGSE